MSSSLFSDWAAAILDDRLLRLIFSLTNARKFYEQNFLTDYYSALGLDVPHGAKLLQTFWLRVQSSPSFTDHVGRRGKAHVDIIVKVRTQAWDTG